MFTYSRFLIKRILGCPYFDSMDLYHFKSKLQTKIDLLRGISGNSHSCYNKQDYYFPPSSLNQWTLLKVQYFHMVYL